MGPLRVDHIEMPATPSWVSAAINASGTAKAMAE